MNKNNFCEWIATSKVLVVLPVLFVISATSVADQWSIDPKIEIGFIQDNNITLSPTNKFDDSGIISRPEISLSRKSERTETRLTAVGDIRRYSDFDILDSEDYKLKFLTAWRSELSELKLKLSASEYSTVTGEGNDTGQFVIGGDRNTISISPSWKYKIASEKFLEVSYAGKEVDYNSIATNFTDYSYQQYDLRYLHRYDPKNMFSVNLNTGIYETDDSNFEAITYGITLGLDHKFTETFSGKIYLGGSETESEIGAGASVVETSDNGLLFMAGLEKKRERTVYNATLSRAVVPSGGGLLMLSDKVKLSLRHRMTQKVDFGLALNAISNENANGTVSTLDRDYVSVSPSVDWWFNKVVKMRLSYQYRQQEYDLSGSEADSDQYMLSIIYNPLYKKDNH